MKYQTFCPLFPGFYGTVFEYSGEEQDIEYYNEENGTNLDYDGFNWDYSEYSDRVAKAFVNRLETELKQFLPIKIAFERINSPREYNFANDSINVEISLSLNKLLKLIKERREKAAQYFKSKYTSCSGFISFHSNDISDWLRKSYILENSAHRIGALLDCLCSIELDQDDIIYWADSEFHIDFSPKEPIAAIA